MVVFRFRLLSIFVAFNVADVAEAFDTPESDEALAAFFLVALDVVDDDVSFVLEDLRRATVGLAGVLLTLKA